MNSNNLIPLRGFELGPDLPWRIGFVALVDEQLRLMRVVGRFIPPRFFGYYFRRDTPIVVGGRWTVIVDRHPELSHFVSHLDAATGGAYSISSQDDEDPSYLLIQDRLDGACWLQSFFWGSRFLQAVEPFEDSEGTKEATRPNDAGDI